VHGKLGGYTARTAIPNWPEGYSIPYDIMLSTEAGGISQGAVIAAQGWAGYHSSLVLYLLLLLSLLLLLLLLLLFLLLSSFAFLLNCLYLNS